MKYLLITIILCIIYVIIKAYKKKKRTASSLVLCHICGKPNCRHIKKIRRANADSVEAMKTYKHNPDDSLQKLQSIDKVYNTYQMHPQVRLENRLKQAVVLYNSNRIDEAEQLLQKEFDRRYSYILTEDNYAYAELQYQKRLAQEKKWASITNEKILPIKKRRNGTEYADFYRNLYFLKIYEKMAVLYKKKKDYFRAAVFIILAEYSNQENKFHANFSDWHDYTPAKAFSILFTTEKIDKIIQKSKNDCLAKNYLPLIKKYFLPEPNQDKCWELYEELLTCEVIE